MTRKVEVIGSRSAGVEHACGVHVLHGRAREGSADRRPTASAMNGFDTESIAKR